MIPERYLSICRGLATHTASLGYDGIQLYSEADLPAAQVGYSVSAEGTSYCSGTPGDWRSEWIVIGNTLSSGDPLILDTSTGRLPILTAFHGQGSWEPWPVADSVESFSKAFLFLAGLGRGREHPVALSENPLPAALRDNALMAIAENNPNADISFWETLLTTDE